jgi:proteasome lid subunit RPN8/RPN11
MVFFKKRKKEEYVKKQWKIKRDCLELILESAKSSYPNEFGGLLRVDAELKDTISEIIILPGTISGDSHAIFQLHMLPIDLTIVGTVHSHPSLSFHPSDADKLLFRKYGKIHIVVAKPFDISSWKAYDYNGNELDTEIV